MLKNPLVQEWVLDPLYVQAFELWLEFYWWCELHDEAICTRRGPSGFAMPFPDPGSDQARKCNRFDYELRKVLFFEMDAAEIPNQIRHDASTDALNVHEATWPKGGPYTQIR